MNVEAYLARIGYAGSLEPTLETLRNLHRAHLFTIPYENLDIHLGRQLSLNEAEIFGKLVTRRRGGWCFEMNALFAWALRELGFRVTLLGAAVNRTQCNDVAKLGHLLLRVDLERPYLCDVGFGDGLTGPLPLAAGHYRQGFLDYELTRSGTGWYWRNQLYGAASGFCFELTPRSLEAFYSMCQELQTSPESGFVRSTVCSRWQTEGYSVLRGVTLRVVTVTGVETRVLENAADFDTVLRDTFGLELPEAADLWPLVLRQHAAWLKAQRTA